MTVSLQGIGLPPEIANLIQQGTLERVFHDALFPRTLFRAEAMAEVWPANLGETMIFSRAGRIPVSTTPRTPGVDKAPVAYPTEQWIATASPYGETIPTHMPTSNVALAPILLRNTQALGLNAAETMNRLTRNRLYQAYLGGNTVSTVVALIATTQVHVASLNGFTERSMLGRPVPVSSAAPIPVTFSNGEAAKNVIAAVPDNPADPLGPGTITLDAVLVAALPARTGIAAATRSRITRVGGGATVDAITPAQILALQDVINSVAAMRADLIPPCSDGYYHVHLTPEGEAQIFQDNAFQRLLQSLPDSAEYRDFAIGQLVGCRFYRETENPNEANSGTLISTSAASALASSEIGGEVVNNAGIPIRRAVIIGGGALYEKYLDESKYITEAGVMGKIGEFSISNNGVQIMTQRIRFIMRAPLDKWQEIVDQTWSWSGDFPVPSDGITGSAARFKRARVVEHSA